MVEESYFETFPETLNNATAEDLFMTTYDDVVHDFKNYQYGMYFMTYLHEQHGEKAFQEFLQCINEKNNGNDITPTIEMQAKALKESFSENVFAEFGDWYNINKDRFADN